MCRCCETRRPTQSICHISMHKATVPYEVLNNEELLNYDDLDDSDAFL